MPAYLPFTEVRSPAGNDSTCEGWLCIAAVRETVDELKDTTTLVQGSMYVSAISLYCDSANG